MPVTVAVVVDIGMYRATHKRYHNMRFLAERHDKPVPPAVLKELKTIPDAAKLYTGVLDNGDGTFGVPSRTDKSIVYKVRLGLDHTTVDCSCNRNGSIIAYLFYHIHAVLIFLGEEPYEFLNPLFRTEAWKAQYDMQYETPMTWAQCIGDLIPTSADTLSAPPASQPSKGAPLKTRVKSAAELGTSKRKKQTCSKCKQHTYHNIRTCKGPLVESHGNYGQTPAPGEGLLTNNNQTPAAGDNQTPTAGEGPLANDQINPQDAENVPQVMTVPVASTVP